jgi:hypothetical protein
MTNKIALITGATSGIGAAFARKFASQKYDLILVGRREEKINALANELTAKNNIHIDIIIAEFAHDKSIDSLVEKIKALKHLEVLANCAGFALKGKKFYEEDIVNYEAMLKVHNLAVVKLTHAVLPSMVTNKKGFIINVSSIMAYFPYARQSIYTASKAFVSLFTESISDELKGTGVYMQALCPGLTQSDLHERIGIDVKQLAKKRVWLWQAPMSPDVVVENSIRCLAKHKVICVPGFANKLIVILGSLKRFLS